MEINGYILDKPLSCDKSGFSKWGFVKRGGQEFFLKEFLSPVYPVCREVLSEEQIESKIKICKRFEAEKSRMYRTISECASGNIVPIAQFFRHKSHYYIITEKIDAKPLSVENINQMSQSQKLIITKIICYSLSLLHGKGIVHGDIKPDNLLFSKTERGIYTAKLIDFDASFFADNPPKASDGFQGDMIFLAPESYLYMAGEEVKVTQKADVFAVGILLHLFWSGEMPYFDKSQYDYVFEAVLNGEMPRILKTIPQPVAIIIKQMLDIEPNNRPSLSSVFMALSKMNFE